LKRDRLPGVRNDIAILQFDFTAHGKALEEAGIEPALLDLAGGKRIQSRQDHPEKPQKRALEAPLLDPVEDKWIGSGLESRKKPKWAAFEKPLLDPAGDTWAGSGLERKENPKLADLEAPLPGLAEDKRTGSGGASGEERKAAGDFGGPLLLGAASALSCSTGCHARFPPGIWDHGSRRRFAGGGNRPRIEVERRPWTTDGTPPAPAAAARRPSGAAAPRAGRRRPPRRPGTRTGTGSTPTS
jgi:hypothetical protein